MALILKMSLCTSERYERGKVSTAHSINSWQTLLVAREKNWQEEKALDILYESRSNVISVIESEPPPASNNWNIQ